MIVESFIKECLDEPTRVQEKHIDVKGRLKDKSNKIESFCVRPYDMHDDTFSQTLSSKSNADKMVFAFDEYLHHHNNFPNHHKVHQTLRTLHIQQCDHQPS